MKLLDAIAVFVVVTLFYIQKSEACFGRLEVPVNPDESYIRGLEADEKTKQNALKNCVDCEDDAKKAAIKGGRCRAIMCDFEVGVLCSWKTSGKPGLPDDVVAAFLEKYPEFLSPSQVDRDAERTGVTYPLSNGFWAEFVGGPNKPDEDRAIELITDSVNAAADEAQENAEKAAQEAQEALASGDFISGLLGAANQFTTPEAGATYITTNKYGQLGEQYYGPELDGYGRPNGSLPGGLFALEDLGIYVPPGTRGYSPFLVFLKTSFSEEQTAARADFDLGKQDLEDAPNFLPTIGNKRWGVYRDTFVDATVGVPKPAQGEYYAVTYVYPGETSVLETPVALTDDTYYLFYNIYENSNDISLKMCCGRCPDIFAIGATYDMQTPIEEDVDHPEWRKQAIACPAGTDQITFICENTGKNGFEGACGIDDIRLYNSAGYDYCEGVDLLAGTNPGSGLPESVRDRTSAQSGNVGTGGTAREKLTQAELDQIDKVLFDLENNLNPPTTPAPLLGGLGLGGDGGLGDLFGRRKRYAQTITK